MKGIVLCSGGLDSTLALVSCLKVGDTVTPMFVDYGQYPVNEERFAFLGTVNYCGMHFEKVEPRQFLEVKTGEEKVGSAWGRGIALVGLPAVAGIRTRQC